MITDIKEILMPKDLYELSFCEPKAMLIEKGNVGLIDFGIILKSNPSFVENLAFLSSEIKNDLDVKINKILNDDKSKKEVLKKKKWN